MKLLSTISAIVLPIIALTLFVVQIMSTNNLAQDGSTLKAITDKTNTLEFENERLDQQIASLSSLLVVHEKAKAIGFIEAKHFLTVLQGQYLVALNQKR